MNPHIKPAIPVKWVEGLGLPFRKRVGGVFGVLRLLAYPATLAGVAAYFATHWKDGFDAHVPGFLGMGAVGVIAVPLFLYRLSELFENAWIRSACPVCGSVDARIFPKHISIPCAFCPAYLEHQGTRVAEIDEETIEIGVPWFEVEQKLIEERGKRLRLPEGCAQCGKAATRREPVRFHSSATKIELLPSWIGYRSPAGRLGAGDHTLRAGQVKPDVSEAVVSIQYPCCDDPHCASAGIKYSSSYVGFYSYRYFKRFCELNRFGSPHPSTVYRGES